MSSVECEVVITCDFYFVVLVCCLFFGYDISKFSIMSVVCFGTTGEETQHKSRCLANVTDNAARVFLDWSWVGIHSIVITNSNFSWTCHLVRFSSFSESLKQVYFNKSSCYYSHCFILCALLCITVINRKFCIHNINIIIRVGYNLYKIFVKILLTSIRWILTVAEDTILYKGVHCMFCVKVMPRCLCCFKLSSVLVFKLNYSSCRGYLLHENIIAIFC